MENGQWTETTNKSTANIVYGTDYNGENLSAEFCEEKT